MKLEHFAYGGDYNPEQWDESVWLDDARLMREAGVNLVSLGIFAWAKLEPAPGQFEFGWLDRVMDLLQANGVQVNLATPTASPPAWLVQKHPEILPITADGVRLWHGGRRHYCPNATAYREHAARIASKLAEHLRNHPALVMWHIDNEYGCHVAECFCDACAAAFRLWLQARYGTPENLNRAWGTAFWSQHYSAWDEIVPPRRAPTFGNPTQLLDWRRFCSDSFLACMLEQKKILRELTPNIPVTTNFMRFFKPLDYWKWAENEDVVSNDSYPDPSDPEWMIESAMACDLMRSLKNGQPWLLMEQAPTHVNWRTRNATKRPGEMRLASYQALARGANGILFFQWRASRAGAEKFHSGMVPHVGTDSRVWREVKSLGSELRGLDELLAGRVQAETAILFDWENWWALELEGKPSNDLELFPRVLKIYAELYRRNISVDFARPDGDLSKYRFVIAPHLYLVGERAIENLVRYVAEGGTLLMNFFSGIVDENDHIRLGGYPAPFRDMLGLWIEEFEAYAEGQTNQIETVDGKKFTCSLWSERIRLKGARALANFCEDDVAHLPAITQHPFGKGTSFYLGTEIESDGLGWLLDRLGMAANVQARPAPQGVEIIRRATDTQTWLLILNYLNADTKVELNASGTDILKNTAVNGRVSVAARDIVIVRLDK